MNHRIGDILEPNNEEESAKKSEPETKKHIGGDDNEMKWNHVYVWSFLIFTPCNKIQKDEPRKIFSIENANKNFPFNIQVFRRLSAAKDSKFVFSCIHYTYAIW